MSKKPFVTKEQVEEIVKTYPTPFHLYDEKGIRENAKALKEAFAWNPGYKEYFPRATKPKITRWGFFQKAKSNTKTEVDNIMQKQLLIMLEKGVVPPIYQSQNIDGGPEFNENLTNQFFDRLYHL